MFPKNSAGRSSDEAGGRAAMRAMVFERPGPNRPAALSLKEAPRPAPGPDEILVRVKTCAVCHTDLHIIDGDLPAALLPVIPGHQAVGVVESVGRAVTSRRPGQRVGVPWLHRSCGTCEFCRGGAENLCDAARFTGYHVHGGFAEYVVAPADFAPVIPDAFDEVEAAPLLCAGIVGFRTLRICGLKKGGRIGMFGFGASAHLALQVARYWQCEVYVFTRSEEHRKLSLELGAAWAGSADDSGPQPIDCAAVFAPAGETVVRALRQTRKGGTVAINAIHLDRIPSFDYSLIYGERCVRSVTNCTRADEIEFLETAARIPLKVKVERFPLEGANDALNRMRNRQVRGAAVLEITKISSKS